VVADATKIGASSIARFWDAAAVDLLVTESSADETVLGELKDLGVQVQTVG
jgi:DeoR/GlpR family transcriptional regulator of sugar metabolism